MKKLILLTLTIISLMTMTACSGESGYLSSEDDNLVTITVPATFYPDATEEDIALVAENSGYESYQFNEDGSVTYTMSKDMHDDLMNRLGQNIDDSIDAYFVGEQAGQFESFDSIDHNEDYSEFNVYVDSNLFTELDKMVIIAFYTQGAYYQVFNGKPADEVEVVVNFIDSETEEVLDTSSYQQILEDAQESDQSLETEIQSSDDDSVKAILIVKSEANILCDCKASAVFFKHFKMIKGE